MKDQLVQQALALIKKGIAVFPCRPKTKKPVTENGFYNASRDPTQIEQWWSHVPRANLAMATGLVSQLFVFDVDPDKGGYESLQRMLDQHGPMPETVKAKTGSGGMHFFFRYPGFEVPSRNGALASGIDIKGDKGYVVLPPSQHPNGTHYQWVKSILQHEPTDAPKWLLDEIRRIEAAKNIPESPSSRTMIDCGDIDQSSRYYLEQAIDRAQEGTRNETGLWLACQLRDLGLSQEEVEPIMVSYAGAQSASYREEEAIASLKSAFSRSKREAGLLRSSSEPTQPDISGLLPSADNVYGTQNPHPDDHEEEPLMQLCCKASKMPERLLEVPGFIGELADFINETNYAHQPVLAMAGATAVQAYLAGRKVRDPSGARSNLNILGIVNTTCGKERARTVAKELLVSIGAVSNLQERPASYQGIQRKLYNNPRSLMVWDEIGQCFQAYRSASGASHLKGILRTITELTTSSHQIYCSDSHADERNDFIIDQPSLTVFGTSTPEDLFAGLTTESIQSGFLGRMLLFEGENQPEDREIMDLPDVPQSLIEQAKAWHQFDPWSLVKEESPKPPVIPRSEEAVEIFRECLKKQSEARAFEDPIQRALWGRTAQKTAQLALVYACSQFGPDLEKIVISREAAQWAFEIVSHVHHRLGYLASIWIADDDFHDRQNQILRFIREKGGAVNMAKLNQRFFRWPEKTRLEILSNLKSIGFLKEGTGPDSGRGLWYFLQNSSK